MVAGGVAAIVYGEPRFTQDVDIVAALHPSNASAFAGLFPDSDFYRFRFQGASERHLRDVRAMLRVLGDTVDVAALQHEADVMGLSAQWEEMERLGE